MRMRIGIIRIEKVLLHDIGGMERVILRDENIGEIDRLVIAAIRIMRREIARVVDDDITMRTTSMKIRSEVGDIVTMSPLEVYPP